MRPNAGIVERWWPRDTDNPTTNSIFGLEDSVDVTYLFDRYILSSYYWVPTVLGTGNIAVNKLC